jgi:hypothetical protein
LDTFDAGRIAYLSRDFRAAFDYFGSISNVDPVAQLYRERAQGFIDRPPPDNWDGATSLSTK